jgi:hypothetical protein
MSKLQIRSIVMSGMEFLFRLEINSYRKRLLAFQKIQNPATRAAVTARALAHLENKPSLQSMLLSQHEDIVFIYLSEALTRNDEASFIFPREILCIKWTIPIF